MREGARSLGYGLVAGALAGVPALLRALGAAEARDPWVLLGLCAIPMAVVAPVVLSLRRARLPHVVSPGDVPRAPLLRLLGASLALAVAPLAWLGSWLEQSTHHRPLGAVTFACVAFCVFVVALIVGRRLLATGRRALILVGLGVPAALGAWLLLRGTVAGFEAGGAWLDGLALVVWTAAGVWLPPLRTVSATGNGSRRAKEHPSQLGEDSGPHGGGSGIEDGARDGVEDGAGARRLWAIAIASWLGVCALGALALLIRTPELTTIAPAFTWPVR